MLEERIRSLPLVAVTALSAICLVQCTPRADVVTPTPIAASKPSPTECEKFASNPANDVLDASPTIDSRSKRRWMEKASKTLRAGRGMESLEAIDKLMTKSRSEIVDEWMEQPEFLNTVLDFGLFVWGAKRDSLQLADGSYSHMIFQVPSAIAAAQAAGRRQDFFSQLYSVTSPVYFERLNSPFSEDAEESKLSAHDLRQILVGRLKTEMGDFISKIETTPPANDIQFCAQWEEFSNSRVGKLSNLGFEVFANGLNVFAFVEDWYVSFYTNGQCTKPSATDLSRNPVPQLRLIQAKDNRYMDGVLALEADAPATTVMKIKPLDSKDFGFDHVRNLSIASDFFSGSLTNSSTNMNRKRAAFVLDRFFCDSLVPINTESPATHAQNRHASEVSCHSCHYKLDPMAGFFANYGARFNDLSGFSTLFFDDGATTNRAKYLENWRDPKSQNWEIGYVRSPSAPQFNSYGQSLDDLFSIVKDAPEVKRCLTKRLFEYVIAPNQLADAGYIDFATQEFTCAAKSNSTDALKRAFKRLVLSRSFLERNPEADRCYDFPPNYDPNGAPPCRVASILQKNCVLCHDSTTARAHLDLSKWIVTSSGEKTFPHLDSKGNQIARATTLQTISDVISTSDEDSRMPKDRYMHPLEREALYSWLAGELK